MSRPTGRRVRLSGAAMALMTLSGCGDFLTESGPGRDAVVGQAITAPVTPPATTPYALITLNAATLPRLEAVPPERHFDLPPCDQTGDGSIGVGDTIGISIFESAPGGLFITDHPENQSGNSVNLPAQQVGRSGTITVPFGGTIPVVGRTAASVQDAIVHRLAGRALEPQAVVSILDRKSGTVSVLGDVGGAARFSLDPGGETLLGAIARAGGPRFPDYETMVAIKRDGVVETERLSEIIGNPTQDIPLAPGDTIVVTHRPDYFLAMGATGQTTSLGPLDRRIAFGSPKISLTDALAEAGGLEDDRANARAVFVYRSPAEAVTAGGAPLPTIYLADLRDPQGYFYASRFSMRPEDVIFVSNAPSTDLSKFLNLILPVAYSASGFNAGLR